MWTIIKGFFGNVVAGWQSYAIVLALGIAIGTGGTWRVMSWKEGYEAHKTDAKVIVAAHAQVGQAINGQKISTEVGTKDEGAKVIIRDHIVYVTKEIHDAATPSIDARFPLSRRFVRVWNDSTSVGDVSADGGRTAESDGTASDTTESAFLDVAVPDNGHCLETRQTLIDLQLWVRRQKAYSDCVGRETGAGRVETSADVCKKESDAVQ